MNKVTMLGTFKGRVIEHAYGETKGNSDENKDPLPQLIVDVALEQWYDEKEEQWQDYTEADEHIVAYLHLFNHDGKESFNHPQVMKVFGWDGTSFAELDGLELGGLVFQVRVEENEFDGKITNKVNWIDVEDAVPGQRIRRLDAADLKAADKKFAIMLKKSGTAVKPKGRGKAKDKVPAAPKTQKDAKTKSEETGDKAAKNRLRREQELKARADKEEATETETETSKSSLPTFGKKGAVPPVDEPSTDPLTATEAWALITAAGEKANVKEDDVQNTLQEELIEATGKEEAGLDDVTDAEWPAIVQATIARFGG